jgi:hypothetical protein
MVKQCGWLMREGGRAEVNVIARVQPVPKIRIFEYGYPLFRIVSLNQNMVYICSKNTLKESNNI